MIRRIIFAPALVAALALPACTPYRAEPLEPSALSRAWLARSTSDESLVSFARQHEREGVAAYDPADGLSLAEAEAVALFYNPTLRLARLRAGVAMTVADHAGRWSDPQLGVDAERILQSVEHPWVIGGSIGLTLPISGRLAAEKDRARAEFSTELERVAEQEWAVRTLLRQTWVQWSAALNRAETEQSTLREVQQLSAVAQRLEQAGELGRVDTRAFQMEAATRAAVLAELKSHATELELDLRALMGISPVAPLALQPDINPNLQPTAVLDGELVTRNPALRVLAAEYDTAERTLRREVRAQYPDLTIGPGFSRDEGDDRLTLGLSLPIPLWNRNQGGVAEALARRDVARAAYEARLQQVTIQAAQANAALQAAQARRQSLESTLLPLALEQENDTRRLAALGEVNTLLILDTLARLSDAKQQVLAARVSESIALIHAHELLGPPANAPDGVQP